MSAFGGSGGTGGRRVERAGPAGIMRRPPTAGEAAAVPSRPADRHGRQDKEEPRRETDRHDGAELDDRSGGHALRAPETISLASAWMRLRWSSPRKLSA